MPNLDAIGFPLRGLPPEAAAGRLADWVRWPIDRGTAADVERAGRRLRVHTLEVGQGARLRTVVELKKRHFLPNEEIVCFLAEFEPAAWRDLELSDVEFAGCPFEPVGVAAFPERLRFRIVNPFDDAAVAGTRVRAALGLLAGRVEPATPETRLVTLPTTLAAQDPSAPPELFTVAGLVDTLAEFTNAATGERCLRLRLAGASGPVDVVVRASHASPGLEPGRPAVAEGELIAAVRAPA
ncbi:MAG: hypothetical protein HYY18_09545 [Planctomycetes bacterium]|nr:hypothetical protein [Planctomycetota bacterium]